METKIIIPNKKFYEMYTDLIKGAYVVYWDMQKEKYYIYDPDNEMRYIDVELEELSVRQYYFRKVFSDRHGRIFDENFFNIFSNKKIEPQALEAERLIYWTWYNNKPIWKPLTPPRKKKCEVCGKLHVALNHVILENAMKKMCQDCCGKTHYCKHCGNKTMNEEYCNRCMERFGVCDGCKQKTFICVITDDEEKFCKECSPFKACECCGAICHKDYIDEKYGYCILCLKRYQEKEAFVQAYNYKPDPVFLGNDDNLFFGIELEVKNPNFPKKELVKYIYTEINKNDKFIYFKDDRSIGADECLDTRYGPHFECVTNPFTYDWMNNNLDTIHKLLDLRKFGCKSFQTTTCAMHVHMSRAAFKDKHLYNFLRFFYSDETREFILKISDRVDMEKVDKYATFKLDRYRLNVEKLAEKGNRYEYENNEDARHIAVNLATGNTVEVRIFRGTLSYKRFMKNIEFCKAVFEYTKNNTSLDINDFIDYVKQNNYKNLEHFIISGS